MDKRPIPVDFEALELEIAEAKDAGDKARASELERALLLDIHKRIAEAADPGADIIEGLRAKQVKVRLRKRSRVA